VAVLTTWSLDRGGRTDLVCDQCGNELADHEPAVRGERLPPAARNQGWRDTPQGGHLCPDCAPVR
jgi:hypothetical protein